MSKFKKKVRTSSVFAFSGRIVEQLASMIFTWLLIKELNHAEFGLYNLFLGLIAYLSISSSFGIIPAVKRFLPEFYQKRQAKSFFWIFKTGLFVRGILSIISIGIIAIFYRWIGPFLHIETYFSYYILFGIGVFFLLQARLFQRVLEALFFHKYIVFGSVIYSLTRVLLLSTVFLMGYGLKMVFAVDIVSYFVLFSVYLLFFKTKGFPELKKVNKEDSFSRKDLSKRLLRYSGFSSLNDLGKNFLDISTGFFVISHFLGPVALSYFAFSVRLGKMISRWLPSRMMRSVISPTFFARYGKSGDKRELSNMFNVLLKVNAFIIFPIFTLVGILGKEIIQFVFDIKYITAYPVLLILLIHFSMASFPVGLPLKTVEKPEILLIGKISSVYNLLMSIFLIQIWGIVGVALATTSAIIIKKLFEYHMSKKYAGIQIAWIGLGKIVINCLMMGIFTYWIHPFASSLPKLLMVLTLSMVLYFIFSLFNKSFMEKERFMINKLIGKKVFVF